MSRRSIEISRILERDRLEDERLGTRLHGFQEARIHSEMSPWYESERDIHVRFEEAALKAVRLRWVRKQMRDTLEPMERVTIRLVYFHGATHVEAAARLGCHVSTIRRALARGVFSLRQAARLEARVW